MESVDIARIAGLYAVTPDLADTPTLVAKVRAAIAGGARMVQYRNKTGAADLRAAQARALASACVGRAIFIVNDDAQLAATVGADGVHVGEDDGALAHARAIVGSDRIIGVSCYDDLARAQVLAAQGADYIAFGSFFSSTVKPHARRASPSLLAQARVLALPLVAIGGITAANAGTLIAAGADAVAVISDVFEHDDLADVTRAAAAIAETFRRLRRP
ncbi:MAG: thiamine phosphate synthase [Betaproteobacteria bacterium]